MNSKRKKIVNIVESMVRRILNESGTKITKVDYKNKKFYVYGNYDKYLFFAVVNPPKDMKQARLGLGIFDKLILTKRSDKSVFMSFDNWEWVTLPKSTEDKKIANTATGDIRSAIADWILKSAQDRSLPWQI